MASIKIPNPYVGVPTSTVSRDLRLLEAETGNLYESIAIVSKRANQVASKMKEELQSKLSEYSHDNDNLEEVHENREQIEISMAYERMPKPTVIATEEFLAKKVYHRNPLRESLKK
jgi:DNA-directed RNA polymerase subunit K/omega